jgi:uncharacterized damage-inducible protein DinB
MTVNDLERAYDYGYWANRKLFQVVSQLTPERFTEPVAGSYGSIRNTLVHTMSAEWGWLDRCGGPARGPALKPDDYPTPQSLIETWGTVEGYLRDFLSTLKDSDLDRIVEYTNPRGEKRAMVLGPLMQHAANHGVHHRGQVALLLRTLGYTPGNFDLLFYDAEKRSAPAW